MIHDHHVNSRDLAIIEKYEIAVTYLYPIMMSFPRRHGVLRDKLIGLMFDQVDLFYQAAKSKQASRLYAADAGMASLRFWLRFATTTKPHIISHRQHVVALRLLSEVGAMLGAWIDKVKNSGRAG